MKSTSKLIAVLFVASLVLGGALSTSAQTFYLEPIPEARPTFGLRFMHVRLDGDADLSTFSGTYDFYVDIPTSEKVGFRLSLPYSRVSFKYSQVYWDYVPQEVSESGVGNVYVGVHLTNQLSEQTKSVFSIGLHLPTASDNYDAASIGLLANFHQARRVLPNAWVVYGNMAWRTESSDGGIFGFEIGPEAWIPEGNTNDESELLLHYGLSGGGGTQHFAFLAELMGWIVITEDYEDFGDRFEHQLAFGVGLRDYTVRPSLWYQIPLDDDLRNSIDGVIGLQVEVSIH